MLTNNFTLLGVAVSNFEDDAASTKFPKKTLQIEVEKKGKYAGQVQTHTIVVYGTNRSIDTTMELLGRSVLVNGLIDNYNGYMSLVAQDILVLDNEKVVVEAPSIKPSEKAKTTIKVKDIDVSDDKEDDLPF